jgi:hypothetical protein
MLDIQLVGTNGAKLKLRNVSLDIVFFCDGKERYRFDAGVTNWLGRCRTNYAALDGERKENQRIFLMDYNTKLEDCDEVVAIHMPSTDELRTRLEAVRNYFPTNIESVSRRFARSNNGRVHAPDVRVKFLANQRIAANLVCDVLG